MNIADTPSNRRAYISPQADVTTDVCLQGPVLVIAPSGRTDEDIPIDPDPPIDEDPNAAPLHDDSNPWETGLW